MSDMHTVELDPTYGTLAHDDDITLSEEVEEVVRLASEFWAAEKPESREYVVEKIRQLVSGRTATINHPKTSVEPFLLHLTARYPQLVIGLRGMGEYFSDVWVCWYTGGARYDSDDDAFAAMRRAEKNRPVEDPHE